MTKFLNDYPNSGKGLEGYWAFLRERYYIHLLRCAGSSAPWTDDPVLQAWRFCNVRREDDKVTKWFRREIRGTLRDRFQVYFATIAFRWFNTIETGELLKPFLMERDAWDRPKVERLLEERIERGETIFTAAFMINSAPGIKKHINILDILDEVHANAAQDWTPDQRTKEGMFKRILKIPRLGNFAAYQIVVDLQYTYLLEDAPDMNTFTVAGPGCAKGISLMLYDEPDVLSYGSKHQQERMLGYMIEAREAGMSDPELWPASYPRLVLSDIENGFCEYAKWRTGHAGGKLKRKYQCK